MHVESSRPDGSGLPCLVLMFKAPGRSKQRLRAEIGSPAGGTVARYLCDCAFEDMDAWNGPCCFAPASADDARWLDAKPRPHGIVCEQVEGNLGFRINDVNARLAAIGHARQIFIGSDCPSLDAHYLRSAAGALIRSDVVLGPADDGGVVLMGIRGLWPPLQALSWSTGALMGQLIDQCRKAGYSIELLEPLHDVDSAADLPPLTTALADDARRARRALSDWLARCPPPVGSTP